MTKLILKYNAIVGRDHFPEIQEIITRLSLEIEDIHEEAPIAGKRLKVILIKGSPVNLDQLDKEMFRFPSITSKFTAASEDPPQSA